MAKANRCKGQFDSSYQNTTLLPLCITHGALNMPECGGHLF